MANPQIYQDELAAFNKKYNLENYDLASLQEFDERFNNLDDFLTESVIGGNPAQKFVNWAARTLKKVLETFQQDFSCSQ